ncbi:hypothetical protein AAFN88_16080 [Pelagibius sp. CAU 1746]|uniref:hypothetical protein n=1 Tax=Pelagibius sp. CAU 1746 TaxID=3140370 RepID=UPI00325C18F3
MKKSLIAAASAFALIIGGTSPSWAFLDDQENTAVAVSVLGQTHTNNGNVNTMNALLQAQGNVLNNNFGNNTFRAQVLNQQNINSGVNSALQGANSVAIGANVMN